MIHKGSPMLQNKEKQAKGLKRIKFEILREKTLEKNPKRGFMKVSNVNWINGIEENQN